MESNLWESKLGLSKLGQWSTDRLEQELVRFESVVAFARAAQMALLSELDHRQVAIGDGCRSLHEWTASRLDLSPENAKVLVNTSRRLSDLPYLSEKLSTGEVSFDRLAEVAKLAQPGSEAATWDMVPFLGPVRTPPPAFPPHQVGKESRTRDLLRALPGHPGKPGPDRLPPLG